jgi:hypothetical protein
MTTMNTGAASLSDERERAAITACALMIKGICLTRPNAEWTGAIEDRIQFMLKQMQAGAAIAAGGAQEAVATVTKTGRVVDFDVQIGAFHLSDGKHSLYAAPLANEASKPAPLVEQDERGAFVKLMGYDLPEIDGAAKDVWESQRATWLEALEFAASTSANVARLSIDDLQGKALEHGFKYWRASDAHGITGAAEQAENLIADLVGVEVEVTSQISPFADVAQGARPVPRDFFVPGQMARPFKAPDAGEHDPWYVALPNGNLIKLGFHADDSVDRAQAEFIADAINAALTASPAFALRALYTYADSANVAQGAVAVGLVMTNDKGEKYGALLDSNIEERTKLYVAPPAQTALTDDARECLMDVVSHHHDFRTACLEIKMASETTVSDELYWQKQIDVLDRMKGQAERALAAAQSASGDKS